MFVKLEEDLNVLEICEVGNELIENKRLFSTMCSFILRGRNVVLKKIGRASFRISVLTNIRLGKKGFHLVMLCFGLYVQKCVFLSLWDVVKQGLLPDGEDAALAVVA